MFIILISSTQNDYLKNKSSPEKSSSYKKKLKIYKKNTTLKMVISTDSESLHVCTVCIWHCEHAHFCKVIFIHHITYAGFYS